MCVYVSYILPGFTLPFEMKVILKFRPKCFRLSKHSVLKFSVLKLRNKKFSAWVFSPLIVIFWFGNGLSIVLCQTLLETDQLICLLCNLHPRMSENMQNTVDKQFPTFNSRNETSFVFLSSR